MPHFACPTIRGMWNWMTVSDCKCMANLSSAWLSLLPGDPTTTPWNLLDTWKPFALGKTVSDPHEATYPVPGSSISSNSYLSDPLRRHVKPTQWIQMNSPGSAQIVSWIEVPECHFSPGCRKDFSELPGGPTTNPWNLLDTWKPFALGKTVSDPQEATYPVPGSSISSKLLNLWDHLRRHVRANPMNPNEFPWICPKSPESKFLNAALLSWMQGFWTARGSNNKSMEPSRHLKTFCLGENCFRPSRRDLSSARLINQFQFLPFRSFEKTC